MVLQALTESLRGALDRGARQLVHPEFLNQRLSFARRHGAHKGTDHAHRTRGGAFQEATAQRNGIDRQAVAPARVAIH